MCPLPPIRSIFESGEESPPRALARQASSNDEGMPNNWSWSTEAGTIPLVKPRRDGPGLVKSTGSRLLSARHAVLIRSSDPRWRELLKGADAISEGQTKSEEGGDVWYGTTSLILAFPEMSELDRAFVAAVAEADPHLRLRATRIAHREAASRAPGNLGRVRCEIRTSVDPKGVRIDVDVQAPLIEGAPAKDAGTCGARRRG